MGSGHALKQFMIIRSKGRLNASEEKTMLDFGFYNMDCMEGMKQFPDKYFDLAIVDPPYGLLDAGMQSTGGAGKLKHRNFNQEYKKFKDWDKAPDDEYFKELERVSVNQIIWGGNYFNLPPCRCFIIWDKLQPWENFSRCEFAWTSFKSPAKIFAYDNRKCSRKIHPTQKPIELYVWLLNKYAKKDDIILDTHVGSASSLIACHRTNHKYVGFEIDKYYYDEAKKRLDAEMLKKRLF